MPEPSPRLRAALADRYELERELGWGGSAVVYLARDLRHDRPVALKVIHPEVSATIALDRFLREIRIAANLQHPNILPLLDSGEADGLPYFATPFVEGASLRERLAAKGRLPFEEVARITREVSAGLAHAHAKGILHRDVKPGNILLSDGHAILADFGLAKAVASATENDISRTGTVGGTVQYISPEQAAGTRELDGRSDLYSLACVVYEMLSGEPPFSGRSPLAVVARHLSGTAEPLQITRPTVPTVADEIVRRALEKEPERRFQTVTEFAEAVESSLLADPEPRVRRRRWLRRSAGVVATAAVVAAGVTLAQRGGAPDLDERSVMLFPLIDAREAGRDEGAGEQVAIMIGATLDHAEPLRWIDGWDWLDPATRSDMTSWSIREGQEIARERSAGYLIDGRIMTQGDSVQVLLRLHRVSDGTIAERSLAGAPAGSASLPELGRRAAVALLPALIDLGTPVPTDVLTGFQPGAVAAWLQGEREYRDSDFATALSLFREALERDSSMALAAMRGAQAASWRGRSDLALELIEAALDREAELTPKQRLLARGLRSYYEGASEAAVGDLREALVADPDWSDAWMALGEVYYHLRPEAASAATQAEAAFRNARNFDPGFTPPLVHLAEITLRRGELEDAEALVSEFRTASPDGALAVNLELMTTCVEGDGDGIDWSTEVRRSAAAVLEASISLGVGGAHPECTVGAFEALYRYADQSFRWSALLALQAWHTALGRHDEARRVISSAQGFERQQNYLFTAGALGGAPFDEEAEASVRALEDLPGPTSGTQLWAIGAWGGSRGQVERVSSALSAARLLRAQTGEVSDSLLVEALEGWMALARADTAGAIARFDTLGPVAPPGRLAWGIWESLGAEKTMLARLRLARGEYAEALRAAEYVEHPQPVVYLVYLAESLRLRARAVEALGREGAAASYRTRLDRLRQASGSIDVPPRAGET